MMRSKICYRCSQSKPVSEFTVETGYSRDGYGFACHDCTRVRNPHLIKEDGTLMTYAEWCLLNDVNNTKAKRVKK